MHFNMGEVTAEAKEVVRDLLGHWNGLWRNTAHSEFCFQKLLSGCCMENGLGGKEDQRQQDTLETEVSNMFNMPSGVVSTCTCQLCLREAQTPPPDILVNSHNP